MLNVKLSSVDVLCLSKHRSNIRTKNKITEVKKSRRFGYVCTFMGLTRKKKVVVRKSYFGRDTFLLQEA